MLTTLLHKFIDSQHYLSSQFDRLLPAKYRRDGYSDFKKNLVGNYLQPGIKVYDIGGGKTPFISPLLKQKLTAWVAGLDIERSELAKAPLGAYDLMVEADITCYQGAGEADLVICQALLEHVKNVEEAFQSIASLLKPGGYALLFVPSRNAWFARLNLILPQTLKKKLLYFIYPEARKNQGFRSYYDHCTPLEFRELAQRYGLRIEEERLYFLSSYFSCLFPAYLLWRFWLFFYHAVAGVQAAETFSMALKKEADTAVGCQSKRVN